MVSKVKQFFKNEWQSLKDTLSKVNPLKINDFQLKNTAKLIGKEI